jgi:hypothetical protein
MFELKINPDDIRKHGMTMPEYMVLGFLRYFNNQDLTSFIQNTIYENSQLNPILDSLISGQFIRIIDGVVHINDKGEKVFSGVYESKAIELINHFNKLKAEYLHINRPTNARKYIVKFKGLLSEGHDIEFIKDVLAYCVDTWKDDDFMRNHINVETFCRHFDKYADQYELRQKSANRINRML